MADLATLAIKVENGDVIKASQALGGLEVASTKSEAATQRLTRRMALLELEARNMDATMSRSQTTSAKLTSALGLSETAAARLGKAFSALSAVAAVAFISREFIANTVEAQAAMAQLEAAVASTGGVAGRSVAELDALSVALQRQTTFSDEAVKGAEAMLLTFDKIRGAEFDRATAAVTDLATRMGGDLQGAAVQVGKALQDPTNGLTALRRSGVSFSAAQVEVIKKLYETGHAAEGQRVILAELEHQFGGSASAARNTLGGALTGLKNDFGDLFERTKEETGALVGFINATGGAIRGIHNYADEIKAVAGALAAVAVAYGVATIAAKSFALQALFGGAATAAEALSVAIAGIGTALTGAGAAAGIGLGPLALLAGAAALAIYDLNKAFDDYDDKVEEASKNTREYVDYLKALGRARSHGPVATPQDSELDPEKAKRLASLTADRESEIRQLSGLNAAYRSSAVALAILNVQYDAAAKKARDKLDFDGKALATLDRLTDGIARQKIQQILLNDQLEREAKLRETRAANADALRSANENVIVAGQDDATAERTRNRFDELNKLQDAERKYQDDIRRATAQQRADAKVAYDETVARIKKEADLNDEAITRARARQTEQNVTSTVRDLDAQTAGIRAMTAAELEGGKAAEAMRVQLAGNDVVTRALNDATARGTTLTDEQAAALRGSAEALERTRINAEKLRAVFGQVRDAANQFFTDVFNRKNPFPALGEAIKRQVIGALSDAVARPITVTIGKILGIAAPEDKQLKAAREMNTAADKMLRAAGEMNDNGGAGEGTFADASVVLNPKQSAIAQYFEKFLKVGGAGVAGYGAGYGIGASTQSGTLGAVGGAVSGAVLGAKLAGPVGAAVGGLAGLAGGILGAGDAARAAAERLRKAKEAFDTAFAAVKAEVAGDDLAVQIAQAQARFNDLRNALKDASPQLGITSARLNDYAQTLKELGATEDAYIARLKQEAAAKVRQAEEDQAVRTLRNQGRAHEADILAKQNADAREYAEAVKNHMSDAYLAHLRWNQSVEEAAVAAGKAAGAIDSLTTSMRGAPSGFKTEDLNRYVQEYARAMPFPGSYTTPLNPLTPSSRPTFNVSPTSTTGTVATAPVQMTIQPGAIQINGTDLSPDEIAAALARVLDGVKERAFGGSKSVTRAQALERVPAS